MGLPVWFGACLVSIENMKHTVCLHTLIALYERTLLPQGSALLIVNPFTKLVKRHTISFDKMRSAKMVYDPLPFEEYGIDNYNTALFRV